MHKLTFHRWGQACLWACALLFPIPHQAKAADGSAHQVKAWVETVSLPTYLREKPETAPIFERDWSYQRARRSVYPYMMDDNMTRRKSMRSYRAVCLENQYVKLCVLPEIGGRLFYAIDKTDNYDIFYHQHVIKPANVGMLGAWISGGVEWNVFHHHRATTNLPVAYKISDEPDGGKTIWIGETEWRDRMEWSIGITLHPRSSFIEITGRLVNSTPNTNSFLYWSNVSTKVDSTYQIIFPPSTDFVTFHCKNWFAHWPVTHERFNDMDFYRNNIDASWWKNHFMSNSMFIFNQKDNFIAGYDHGRNAGTMITGNHYINRGGKFWLWGPNSQWDSKILTDSDGHYIELMMGAYSDNQPDYTWLWPYEEKTFKQYFYGIKDIGGVKAGSKEAALNFEPLGNNHYAIGVNVTSEKPGMNISVSDSSGILWDRNFDASPMKSFVDTVALDGKLQPWQLTVCLRDSAGQTLLCYQPRRESSYDKPLPQIVERPKRAQDIASTEECYLTGLRNLQFHNPFINPKDYFQEVLRRDSLDTRSNTMLGVMARQEGKYDEALSYLRKACLRLTHDYTHPADAQALYNLGLTLRAVGKDGDAIDTLYRSSWNYAYNAAANLQLAQIYCRRGDYDAAIDRLNDAIDHQYAHVEAWNQKATIYRILGNRHAALLAADRALGMNPMDVYANYEKDMLTGDNKSESIMNDDPEIYLELAMKYFHSGLYGEMSNVLNAIDRKKTDAKVKMWLGYLACIQGQPGKARKLFDAALLLPVDSCHPFRLETIAVLDTLKKMYPGNAKPWYYAGCLLYNKQQDEAARQWRRCVEINPKMDLAWRNLGWYYWLYKKNYSQAAAAYARATALNPNKALYWEEQDQVLEADNTDVETRYKILKKHHNVIVSRYNPLVAEIATGTYTGDCDYVLRLLSECYFPTREGVANFHDTYVDAVLMAGLHQMEKGKYNKAIEILSRGFEYPDNHQVFLVDKRTPRDAQLYFYLAEAYGKMGLPDKAAVCRSKAADVNTKDGDCDFWKALALKKSGLNDKADSLFRRLIERGKAAVVADVVNFYGAEGTTGATVNDVNAGAYYTQALGEIGLGNYQAARELLRKSLQLRKSLLWSKVMLQYCMSHKKL